MTRVGLKALTVTNTPTSTQTDPRRNLGRFVSREFGPAFILEPSNELQFCAGLGQSAKR
jgi:hypothetical protein